MNTALAPVESIPIVFRRAGFREDGVVEINDLEVLIDATDGDADTLLWQQAERVYRLLDARVLSQRKLARRWINIKTGKPYVLRHVQVVQEAFADYLNSQWPDSLEVLDGERPRFRDVYNAIANRGNFGNGDDEWFTRADIIEAARSVLGEIDLDPASCASANTVVRATRYFTKQDDGLAQRWAGRLWMNPPFSKGKITRFCDKVVESVRSADVSEAIVLVRSDTSTRWWTTLTRTAVAISFPEGRVAFWKPNVETKGKSNFGTAVFYFGPHRELFLQVFRRFGLVVFIPDGVRGER
jgi:phage N-6-adenine-methyltransferase